jgi:hypothetical protein
MKFKIYDSVPVPNRVDRRSYPFKDLEVDQCFKVECDRKQEKSIRSSATHWNKKHPERRYIVRRLPNDEEGKFPVDGKFTIGVWRVQ